MVRHALLPIVVALTCSILAAQTQAQDALAKQLLVAPFDEAKAKAAQQAWATHLGRKVVETNAIGMKLALIPAGQFKMGSSDADIAAALRADSAQKEEYLTNERPAHDVTITRPFYMSVYEVTQADWRAVMRGSDNNAEPSYFSSTGSGKDSVSGKDTSRFPVEQVSWYDAIEFCNRLSKSEGLAEFYDLTVTKRESDGSIDEATVSVPDRNGKGYRLPTEAEWEYACRAGTTSAFHFGNISNGEQANVNGDYPYGTTTKGTYVGRTTTVGSYTTYANNFGLYDMHGNVWEWCEDWYDKSFYTTPAATKPNPVNTTTATYRVLRGGSWYYNTRYTRSAYRFRNSPVNRSDNYGFRVLRTP